MNHLIYNTIGTVGVITILTAYFLLQTGRLHSHQLRYSVLNLIGSSMILFSLIYEWNFPSFVVEAFWVLISIVGIVRYALRRRHLRQLQEQRHHHA